MTPRVDPRPRVRADRLKVIPEGARAWHARHEGVHGVVLEGRTPYHPPDGRITVAWADKTVSTHQASSVLVDLSAPTLVLQAPTSLDALPAALRELHRDAVAVRAVSSTRSVYALYDARDHIVFVIDVMDGYRFCEALVLPSWPDLNGLSDDHAARVVVAAAIEHAT